MKTIKSKLAEVDREIESLANRISPNPMNRHERRRNEALFRKLERKQGVRYELARRRQKQEIGI